ncbi:rab GTPase-activating protein 22-like isoform X4 [Salvia miltiorrhiza]|uniref:rab GTPase-activating protein 22-like isoform X4 n=1 Tax=Salvia miltiorrhiza TaxID=226208 RepID=UPI0025AB8A2F|nr:rab GTPase-activating protein 22-like isoform X4 [Salvia miltiorrhiza]
MSAVTFPCLRCLVCGDLRSLQETEAAFILSPFSRERIILCKLGKMWKDVGTPADSYYQVRPDCTDVPERKFRIKGVHPSISGEVWEFLLGCYDPSSTFEEREQIRQRRSSSRLDLPLSRPPFPEGVHLHLVLRLRGGAKKKLG